MVPWSKVTVIPFFIEEDAVSEPASCFDNLQPVKLLKTQLLEEPDARTKIFRVTLDLRYKESLTIGSGEQFWDCRMVFESPQTGWKILEFGH